MLTCFGGRMHGPLDDLGITSSHPGCSWIDVAEDPLNFKVEISGVIRTSKYLKRNLKP
jgi:hypothetical protein